MAAAWSSFMDFGAAAIASSIFHILLIGQVSGGLLQQLVRQILGVMSQFFI
jgi:hypothetical protein